MTKEKQIEDVVDILYNTERLLIAKDDMVIIAKSLYKANYRRQTEGAWIEVENQFLYRYKCSSCEEIMLGKMKNYCPHCGARMKGEIK